MSDDIEIREYQKKLGDERAEQVKHYVAKMLGTIPFPPNCERAHFDIQFQYNDNNVIRVAMEGNAQAVVPEPPPAPPVPQLQPLVWWMFGFSIAVTIAGVVLNAYRSIVGTILLSILAGALLHALAAAIMGIRRARTAAQKAAHPDGPRRVK